MSIRIKDSVGRGGKNRKPDTRKIQKALNQVMPRAPLEVDGDCGPNTIRRIEAFQRRLMRNPDGRIDPAGRTLDRLNAELALPPVKKSATKKAATKKAATKKASTKKAATKKAATKKAATKKAATKKAATKKAATKKAATKKAATKKAATKKAATKKAATRKRSGATGKSAAGAAVKAAAAVKKAAAKKAAAKKAAPKKPRSRSSAITITGSVGRGGDNRAADVRLIQQALNEVMPAAPIKVDGDCGTNTIDRIERFQGDFMRNPDGRVDPGGNTLRRLASAAPSMRGAWKGDSSKWSESKKLDSLDSGLRDRVARVLDALKAEGFKPKIVYAWRSVEVQQQLVAQGHSKVRFSFHNAQFKNGRPRAYAADIIDRRWAWSDAAMANGFWDALGRIAKAEGLFWGGDWRSFKDWAHVQSFPNSKLRDIKRQSGVA